MPSTLPHSHQGLSSLRCACRRTPALASVAVKTFNMMLLGGLKSAAASEAAKFDTVFRPIINIMRQFMWQDKLLQQSVIRRGVQ